MLEIVSLKQSNTVDEYYEEFESLLNLLQLLDEYAFSIFLSNLKPELSKPIRFFYPNCYHYLSLNQKGGVLL